MSMTSCAGCGLPRAEDQIGTVVCPVCAAEAFVPRARSASKPKQETDPTENLPADVGELSRVVGDRHTLPRGLFTAFVFLLGTTLGIGVILGWQAFHLPDKATNGNPEQIVKANPVTGSLPTPIVAIAPMPREPAPPPPELAPSPRKVEEPLPPTRVVVLEINEPNQTYTIPSTFRKAEKVVLKGKVKKLNVSSISNSSTIDASGLEAATVSVTGRIDERSVLKVYSPGGQVTFNATVTGNSTVEIRAPGGEVKFNNPRGNARTESQIDGGSKVLITASTVDLRGDVNGINTRVTIEIPTTGSIKLAAIRGIATVEYRVVGEKGEPEVLPGVISPTANLIRIE